ncbi:MAG: hypothetical protein OXR62_11005 [Ahrensia sp.]|nr:hypothetical protein [Ahrensia sp.]
MNRHIHPDQWRLSDTVAALTEKLPEYEHQRLTLEPEMTHWLCQELRAAVFGIRELEEQISQLRWNIEAARDSSATDAEVAQQTMTEVFRPGSNLHVLDFERERLRADEPQPEGAA